MDKLDRLGWAEGMSFVSFGLPIGVRVSVPGALSRLADRLPPGFKASPSPIVRRLYSLVVGGAGGRPNVKRFHMVYADATPIARTLDPEEALEAFESDLRLYIATEAQRRVFVHAGVVGWEGRAVVIPGRSLSGKSTLVAALLRAGATYYSDEYAVLDARGRAHPYLVPLSVRPEAGKRARRRPAGVPGPACEQRPLPVGLVVVSEYRPGASWRPRPLSAGQAMLALLANTIPARRKPEASLAALGRVVARAPALKGVRGEAEEAAGPILAELGRG